MSHRNIQVTSQTIDYQYQSIQGRVTHGPGVIGGNFRNSFQHNAHLTVPVPVPIHVPANSLIDGNHLPEQYNNSVPFVIPPYSAIVHHPIGNSVTQETSFYSPYMNTATFSATPTYGSYGHMPYHGVVGIPSNEFGRNSFICRLPSKVKNAEIHGHIQNSSASTSSRSAADSSNISHMESGAALTVHDQLPHAHYLMTPVPSTMEVGSRGNTVDRSEAPLDSVMVPGPMYMVAGSYSSQPFLPVGHVWSQLPAAPLIRGGNVSRSASGLTAVQGYQGMASNSTTSFLPHMSRGCTLQAPPPPPPPPPPPHMHVVGISNVNFYQVAGPSYRVLANVPPHGHLTPPQEGLHLDLRNHVLPTGIRIYQPQRGTVPDATVRSQSTPYLRFMPREEIAELVIPDNYEEISVDQHRDLRMDIEHMSYEELLELGDRIGNVSTGLTVKAIRKHLKTRIHVVHGKVATESHDFESCIICQCDFHDEDRIGILSCRHEYHASCLEKWLLVKNVCPVCISPAVAAIEQKSKS